MENHLVVCDDAEALAVYARDWLVRLAGQHFARSESKFSIALSGGSTPKRLYQLLADLPSGALDWNRVLLLWGDERNVPSDDEASNFRLVKENLLDRIEIPEANVLSVPNPGDSPQESAEQYEQLLRQRLQPTTDFFPSIDCVLLGMGEDVHTASLFPRTAALGETSRLVVANHVPQLDCWRITLTAPFINRARNVAFLLSGAGKREALDKLWNAPFDPERYPSHLIRPVPGQLWFLLDKAAVGDLPRPS